MKTTAFAFLILNSEVGYGPVFADLCYHTCLGEGKVMAKAIERFFEQNLEWRQHLIARACFHCTPLVDMDLDAVKVSRAWIKENQNKKWGV